MDIDITIRDERGDTGNVVLARELLYFVRQSLPPGDHHLIISTCHADPNTYSTEFCGPITK